MKKIVIFLMILSIFTGYTIYNSKNNNKKDYLDLEQIYNGSHSSFDSFDNKTFLTLGQGNILKVESHFIGGQKLKDAFIKNSKLNKIKEDLVKLKVEKGLIISKDGSFIEYVFDTEVDSIPNERLSLSLSKEPINFENPTELSFPKEGNFLIYLYLNEHWYLYEETYKN